MENLSKRLNLRSLAEVDQSYMEDALLFLDEYQILIELSQLLPWANFNLERIHLEDFKEWLAITGSPNMAVSLNDEKQKLVSFSLGLMHFYQKKEFPMTIADVRLLLESSEQSYQETTFVMLESLLLLDKIANR